MSDQVYLIKLTNGQITQFNIKTKRTLYTTEIGHTHQIQRAKIHPNNSDLMLTTGFDGTIRKWNLKNMQMESLFEDRNATGRDQVIYAAAWCKMTPPKGQPADAYSNLAVVGTSVGKIKLLDLARNKIVT